MTAGRFLSLVETVAFIAAAFFAVLAGGHITGGGGLDSFFAHAAVIAGGIGAAAHGLIHDPPWTSRPPGPPVAP